LVTGKCIEFRARVSVGTLKCEVYLGEMFILGKSTGSIENFNTAHLREVKIESYPLIGKRYVKLMQ
jgi:hypothetical protein